MQQFLRRLLLKPVIRLTDRYSARPDRERVFDALTKLLEDIRAEKKEKGLLVPFECQTGKFIIFSDQHKGGGNGADDFAICAPAYNAALDYYAQGGFHFVSLGDSEELWENSWMRIKKTYAEVFKKEAQFIPKNAFLKIYGNHDLFWDNDPLAPIALKSIYDYDVPIHEGVVLQTTIKGKTVEIFCTHGHQGDAVSDGNWFSKFFVSRIWAPLQAYLKINPNTPAYDTQLKTLHNKFMYEWSAAQHGVILLTGHTHQPVFESLTHMERLYRRMLFAIRQNDTGMIQTLQAEIHKRKFTTSAIQEDYMSLRPSYFNSGCCCFDNGAITGIEISDGIMRLIEWISNGTEINRKILEEVPLEELMEGFEGEV